MNRPIVVIGSSNTDMIVRAGHIPRPGETVLGGEFSTAPGGKGANQAVAAARAAGRVVFLARVGADLFGAQAVEGFRKDGIDVSRIGSDPEAPSGVALIMVDDAGENSIAVAPGANARLTPDDIRASSDLVTQAALILMQLEIPLGTVRTAAELAHHAGVPVILNPAPAQKLDEGLLGLIDIITPNESEAEELTGVSVETDDRLPDAAGRLHGTGIDHVLITLGARGVYVSSSEWTGFVPGFEVQAVDSTAAGDVFNGVLAVAIAEGKGLEASTRLACAAAALSVTRLGAQPSAPTRREIERFANHSSANGLGHFQGGGHD